MPLIQHKQTGYTYPVSNEGLEAIKANPLTRDIYHVLPEAAVPDEVERLMNEELDGE